MPVRIRLSRAGAKKRPFYRIVAIDSKVFNECTFGFQKFQTIFELIFKLNLAYYIY